MSSNLAAILDAALVGAVAFGLSGWQLWSLAREKKRDDAASDASAESPRHPPGEQVADDR